jgi:glycosyltransferase involved in cell wall biosynthesis
MAQVCSETDGRPFAKHSVVSQGMHLAVSLLGTDRGESGIGHYVRSLLPVLARQLEAMGGRITVIGSQQELSAYAEACSSGIVAEHRVKEMPASLEAAWHLWRIGSVAEKLGADCLLLPAGNRRLAARSSIPCVAVVHDLAQLSVAGKYDALRMFYVKQVLRRVLLSTERLVAVSSATRDQLKTISVAGDAVEVVYNGISHDRFYQKDQREDSVLAQLGLLEPYILYSSRLEHPGKNHARLMRAFASSRLKDEHLLVFAGKDWGAEEYLRKLSAELGISARVRFLGYVADEVLPALVRNAKAVTMVGLCEGFGLPAVEALACGTPLVASDAGALPEVSGGLGELCDPLSVESIRRALETAAESPAVRARTREEGPAWAAQFSWDRAGQRLVEVCRGAIA